MTRVNKSGLVSVFRGGIVAIVGLVPIVAIVAIGWTRIQSGKTAKKERRGILRKFHFWGLRHFYGARSEAVRRLSHDVRSEISRVFYGFRSYGVYGVLCSLRSLARRTYSSEHSPDVLRCGCFAFTSHGRLMGGQVEFWRKTCLSRKTVQRYVELSGFSKFFGKKNAKNFDYVM